MHTIEIDFDVFKKLTMRRTTEDISCNDVMRDLLGLPPAQEPETSQVPGDGENAWVAKGVLFPAGSEFRARYRGKVYSGKVDSGALMVNGQRFRSPSAAAVSITGNPVNGWNFWQVRMPGDSTWRVIASLRD